MINQHLEAAPKRPKLRLVRPDDLPEPLPTHQDAMFRDSRLERVRWLQRTYNLQVVVKQHTFGRMGLESLSNDELKDLHRELERARECVVEGVSLDEAGFIRDLSSI